MRGSERGRVREHPGERPREHSRGVTFGRVLWLTCLVLVWALLALVGALDILAFLAGQSDTPYAGRADDRTAAWWTLFGLVVPLAFLAAVLTSLELRARRRRRGRPPRRDRRTLTDGSVG